MLLAHDGGLLCLIGSHGSGKTTLVSAVATLLSDRQWTPDPIVKEGFKSSFSSETSSSSASLRERLRARVYVHLTMGATTSTSRHSGLLLPTTTAIPQMTQLRGLLATWIGRIMHELRTSPSVPNAKSNNVEPQLLIIEDDLRSNGVVDVERDCDLGYVLCNTK